MTTFEDDDFLDELPTAVLVKRLIDDVLAETAESEEEETTEELDPSEFRAIGTGAHLVHPRSP